MAVKIDMDMPKSCYDCHLRHKYSDKFWRCNITSKIINADVNAHTRYFACPLKEIEE